MEWQPIETAPKDGSKFLAHTSDWEFGRSFNICIQEARWDGISFRSKNGQMINYWMPLPPPPKDAA